MGLEQQLLIGSVAEGRGESATTVVLSADLPAQQEAGLSSAVLFASSIAFAEQHDVFMPSRRSPLTLFWRASVRLRSFGRATAARLARGPRLTLDRTRQSI